MNIVPLITEKSYVAANTLNKYTFVVPMSANKIEIAKEVESVYGVKVLSIRTIVKPGKLKRDPRTYKQSRRGDTKKAILTLKDGDKIDSFFNLDSAE